MLADRPDGRRLTAEEQFQLDDLERRLLADDGSAPRPTRRSAGTLRAGVAVVAAAGCGLLVLAGAIGGPAGAAATALALAGTAAVSRLRMFRRR